MLPENNIQKELLELSPLLASMDKTSVFSVPEGYFKNFSSNVWATLEKDQLSVPEGYFDQLATSILDKIRANEIANESKDLFASLEGLRNQSYYQVPDGYFDSFAQQVVEKIDAEEVLSPLMESLRHQQVFEVPEGYFNQFNISIPAKTTPVVKMEFSSRWVKMAIAAMLTGAITLGVYKFAGNDSSTSPISVPVATIIDPAIEAGQKMNEQQFNEALKNLSEDAIVQYLEKNGSEADVAVLTDNIDEKSLPSEDDYLLDDQALEKYLNTIENKTLNN
jgi:hypothetical protein